MARQPNYERVYGCIKSKISDGTYEVGSLLPPEPVLQEQYNVSRTTVRKAVENLAREGFVAVKQGKGTEVLDYITMQSLNKMSSFSKTLQEKGYSVRSKSVYVDTVCASPTISKALNLEDNATVVRLQRIQLANEVPIAMITNYLPMNIGKSLLGKFEPFVSLYQYIEEHHNLRSDSSNDRITAKLADFSLAHMLEVPVNTALIYVKRICYSGGKPLSVDILQIIGSMYEFEVNLLNRDSGG